VVGYTSTSAEQGKFLILGAGFEDMNGTTKLNDLVSGVEGVNYDEDGTWMTTAAQIQVPVTGGYTIYYYLNDMCDDCIRQDLNELYKFQNLVGREYVKVCPVCWEDEEEYIPVKELLREFNAEICRPCNVYFPVNNVDGHRMRYFVFIDQDSNIKSVFIPRKNEQTTTQIYLQSLSHLLLE
jgi:hypothetical protein